MKSTRPTKPHAETKSYNLPVEGIRIEVASTDFAFFNRLDPEDQAAYVRRLVALEVEGRALTDYLDRLFPESRLAILERAFADWLAARPRRPLPPVLRRRSRAPQGHTSSPSSLQIKRR